jgi:hypothetical protein
VHSDGILHAAFGPDGKGLATACENFRGYVWDYRKPNEPGVTMDHDDRVKTVEFSIDGKWVLTASDDRTARVWTKLSGHPLTPPLRHKGRLISADFLKGNNSLITTDSQGAAWRWDLPLDKRSAEELSSLSFVLSNDPMVRPENVDVRVAAEIAELYERLQNKYPQDFSTTLEQEESWHLAQVEISEAEQDWFAAVFHLKRLLDTANHSEPFARRLRLAQEQLTVQKQR